MEELLRRHRTTLQPRYLHPFRQHSLWQNRRPPRSGFTRRALPAFIPQWLMRRHAELSTPIATGFPSDRADRDPEPPPPAAERSLPPDLLGVGAAGRALPPLARLRGGGNERRELPLPAAAGRAPAPRAPRRPASQRGPPGRDRGEPEPAAPPPRRPREEAAGGSGSPRGGSGAAPAPPAAASPAPAEPPRPVPAAGPGAGALGGPGAALGGNFGPAAVLLRPRTRTAPASGSRGSPRRAAREGGGGESPREPRAGARGEAGRQDRHREKERKGERGGAGAEGGVSPGVLVYLGGSALGCR